jgi:S-formylglutathione hydrolase
MNSRFLLLFSRLAVTLLFISGIVCPELSAVPPARLSVDVVPAPSLAGSIFGDTTARQIAVYLPPSYYTSQARFPVVYFLAGYGEEVLPLTDGTYGITLPDSLDRVITDDSLREMILVVVSGRNALGGSFYVNSPITGNWEDFVVRDLIPYVDAHYRTIADAASRGLCGHSMGGSGALSIAMHCPNLFGALYLMSAGMTDSSGLKKTPFFASAGLIDTVVQIQESLKSLGRDAAWKKLGAILQQGDWTVAFTFAYAAAFIPDTAAPFPCIAYPYHRENGQLVADSIILRRWECGFGAIPMKLWRYRDNLMKLRKIGLECGLNDEFSWIREGCGYLSIQLDVEEIPHTTTFFRGGHQDKLGQRIKEAMWPFFSDALSFQS